MFKVHLLLCFVLFAYGSGNPNSECTWELLSEFCADAGQTKELGTLSMLETCIAAVRQDAECGNRFKYSDGYCGCLKQGEDFCTTEALQLEEVAFELNCKKDFDEEKCNQVVDTDFIHWTHISGEGSNGLLPTAGCTGIEFSSKSTSEQSVTLTGSGVSDATCIGQGSYTFTVVDEFTLEGTDEFSNAFTLTRENGQRCFTGHWIVDGVDYLAHVDANIIQDVVIQQGVSTQEPESECSEYFQQEKNGVGHLEAGQPNKLGFEFTASDSGRLHTISLPLAASYIGYSALGEIVEEAGEVSIAIYKGRGFGNLLRTQNFTAGAVGTCINTECALHDYTFSNPIDVIESETYTVGFSLIASVKRFQAPNSVTETEINMHNGDVAVGGFHYYQHYGNEANPIEDSKRNAWYWNMPEYTCPQCPKVVTRMEEVNGYPLSAYFGTRICPHAAACSEKTLEGAQNWDNLVDVLTSSGSLRRRRSLKNVNDVFEVILDAMNTGEILNLKY